MKAKRSIMLDLVKGIGIGLMVIRHARAPYSEYFVLFHMALFFIASGYLYNEKNHASIDSLKVFFGKKIKGLWKPYFGYSCMFVLLNNVFLNLNIYTTDPEFLTIPGNQYTSLGSYYSIKTIIKEVVKAIFFQTNTQMGGALWFFYTLFVSLVLYASISYFFQRFTPKRITLYQYMVSCVFLCVGFICGVQNIDYRGLPRVLTVYCLIHIGYRIKQKNIMHYFDNTVIRIVSSIMSAMVLFGLYDKGTISIVGNRITNPVYFLVVSIAGWVLIWNISYIIQPMIVGQYIAKLSIHSVPIIGLHFLCFKVVSLIIVVYNNYPYYRIAEFPVIEQENWWLAYTVVGIVLSITVEKLYKKIKSTIVSKK